MKTKTPGKSPNEPKISETILDFGEPFLSKAIAEDTPVMVVREVYQLVVMVWNAHVTATPRWSQPQFLEMLRQQMRQPEAPAEARQIVDMLSRRWQEKFAHVPYAVGEWHVRIRHDHTLSFYCDARLPPNASL